MKLTWKFFNFEASDDEELPNGAFDIKRLSKCSWFAKLGGHILNGLLAIYDCLPWRHLLPIVFLIVYTIFGGWLFCYLETQQPSPTHRNQWILSYNQSINGSAGVVRSNKSILANRRMLYRKEMVRRIWRLKLTNTTHRARDNYIERLWTWYDGKNVDRCVKNETRIAPENEAWTMWNAMFFSAQLYTTIGYGNIAPSTTSGRVAVIFYAMFGIPIVLTILNDWGILLFNFLKYLYFQYTRFKYRGHIWMSRSEVPDEAGELPVKVAVFLLIMWICTCAGIFLIWEDDWNYFTSFYFFFISLTTIGLGDVIPRYPQYTLMSFILVLCGLSVVSMSFTIIQTKVESLFRSLMLGIEQEYWQKQVDPRSSQFAEDVEGPAATMGVMQLWKNQSWRQKILFRLMDKSKKKMLQELWERKANTRNQFTQTPIKTYVSVEIQADLDEEEAEKYRNRKYIYNLLD